MFWFIKHFLINRRINKVQNIYLQSAHMIFSVVTFKEESGPFIGIIYKSNLEKEIFFRNFCDTVNT